MRVLITGGAGYIGSACVRWLLKNGHDPVVYDNLSEGNADSVPGGRLLVGDILDLGALCASMKDNGVEAVMHFAAVASVPDSISQPDLYWRVNALGTKNVLDAMRLTGVRKVLISSTAATYSFESEMPLTEDSPQAPVVPYGTSKLAAEWLTREYGRAYGLGYTILRYFNASGADPDGEYGEDRCKESHIIPLLLETAMQRRDSFKVFGADWDTRDGTCVRDYIHTDDLAQAHQLALEAIEPGDARVYTCGTGVGVTVKEVIEACQRVVGKPIRYEVAERRSGDPGVLVASPERLIHELGWRPQYTDIEQIVATAWRWASQYPDGYQTQGRTPKSADLVARMTCTEPK